MNQTELVALMTKMDADEWLTAIETKDNIQEEETLKRCEVWLDACTSWVN